MKKITAILAAILLPAMLHAASGDADTITDIQEKAGLTKTAYSPAAEGDTMTVKKGEGFDFKVPEILITGQVDTKIMLTREINSLEDLQSVKSILYEREKIYMPDYYLKEESLSPQALELSADRDFIGQLKLSAGTFNTLSGSSLLGRAFDADNKVILRLNHDSFMNERVNDVDTSEDLNSGELFYSTKYDAYNAVYSLSGAVSNVGNPFPADIFGRELNDYSAGVNASFSGTIMDYNFNAGAGYAYFNALSGAGGAGNIYKENTVLFNVSGDRDFELSSGKKIKLTGGLDVKAGQQTLGGTDYSGSLDMDFDLKAVLYFDAITAQGGVKALGYRLKDNYLSAAPYLNLNFMALPDISLYFTFDPRLTTPDFASMMEGKFVAPSAGVKPSTDSANIKTGLNATLFGFFTDIYWGYRNTDNYITLDESGSSGYFIPVNCDVEYSLAGFSVEAMRVSGIKLGVSYEYRNMISSSTTVTYLPLNEAAVKGNYETGNFTFGLKARLLSSFYGTTTAKAPPAAVVDADVSWKLSGLVTVSGYINNLLNNNYYLLYYYKEQGLNLGIGVELNF
jgi:outer membrane receptor protein involved in Fe transport